MRVRDARRGHKLQQHRSETAIILNGRFSAKTSRSLDAEFDELYLAITRLVGELLLENNAEWQLRLHDPQPQGLSALGDSHPSQLSAAMS